MWKILSGVSKNATICDVMDRPKADCTGVHTPPTVDSSNLVHRPHPSFKAPSSGQGGAAPKSIKEANKGGSSLLIFKNSALFWSACVISNLVRWLVQAGEDFRFHSLR